MSFAPPVPSPSETSSVPLSAPPGAGSPDSPAPANPLHFADTADIDSFVTGLRQFEAGEMSPDAFRVFRLARGTYGQRQPDASMVRVKIPQGILDGPQLAAMADVTDRYSRGFGHVTTRQNIQIHFVPLGKVPELMHELAAVGLTTKEACGNTVRNVTACAIAGVCGGAPFDVTPHAQATTRHFLRHPLFQALPRKFKIAFSGCPDDCAQGAINDVGFIAQTRAAAAVTEDPAATANPTAATANPTAATATTPAATATERGFRVRVAGGLSTSPENGHLLYEFLPEDQVLPVLEAVLRVFDRLGNRLNKSRARIKYVVRKLGWDGFRAAFDAELAAVKAEGRGRIAIATDGPTIPASALRPRSAVATAREGHAAWRLTNAIAQRQPGFYAVVVRLVRGDITSAQMRALGALANRFGDGTARLSNEQNAVLPSVAEADLPALHAALLDAGLGLGGARTISDVTSCPGADTCNLAVTHSRELALALTDKLENESGASAAVAAAQSLDIKISGCPNSCGQHHIAAIGFHGTMRRVGGNAVPEYQLHLGGGIDAEHGATFGRQVVKVPARRVPDAVLRLLQLYTAERAEAEPPLAYFRRVDAKVVVAALADLARMDEATARPEDFIDLGQDKQFVVAIGQGECAA